MSSTTTDPLIPVELKRSVRAEGAVLLQDDVVVPAEVLLDPGAEINVISQQFALQHDLTRVENAELPRPTGAGEENLYCYGAYRVKLRLTDSWGKTKTDEHLFYAIKRTGSPILMGMTGLSAKRIHVDCFRSQYRFEVESHALRIVSASEFVLTPWMANPWFMP